MLLATDGRWRCCIVEFSMLPVAYSDATISETAMLPSVVAE
jgi:hypothetical protein